MNINVESAARNQVFYHLNDNPNVSLGEIQANVRNEIQKLKQQGIKISKKEIAQINALIVEEYNIQAPHYRANFATQSTPTVTNANKQFNSATATKSYKHHNATQRHYDEFNSMSKKGRQNLHKRNLSDAKAAFGTDEYLEYLRKNSPELYKEATQQPVQTQSIQQEEYISSKKKKQLKKQAEINSATEHQKARRINTKPHRNAKYTTTQNQMTKEAKQAYLSAQKASEAFVSQTSTIKSAEESMNFFIEKGLANIETTSSQTSTIPTGSTTTPKTGAATTTPKPKSNVASEIVENVSNASKKAPKGKAGKIWAAVGIAGATLAGIFGYKTINDKQENKLDTAA